MSNTVYRLCKCYGPGRLPFASRRDIGGGIAMAATGLLASVLWFGGAWLLHVSGIADDIIGFFIIGLFFLPLSLPTSFIVGTILWGKAYPKENNTLYGAIFGGITAISSLTVGSLAPGLFLVSDYVLRGEMGVFTAVAFSILFLPISLSMAILLAGWIVIPLGIFGGWYHERVKNTQ